MRYNKALSKDDVQEAVDSLTKLGIIIAVPTSEIINTAISLAFQYNVTFYDAYFLSLAEAIQFVLVTADEEFYKKVKERGSITFLKNLA